MVGNHDSMGDLAVSLSCEVICSRDKSTMVEELSGLLDSPLLITSSPKFSRSSLVKHKWIFNQLNAPCYFMSNRLNPTNPFKLCIIVRITHGFVIFQQSNNLDQSILLQGPPISMLFRVPSRWRMFPYSVPYVPGVVLS